MKSSLLLILGALAIGACSSSSPQSMARDADNAQHDADEQKAYASEEVRMKTAATQQNADAENRESNRVGLMKRDEAQGTANKARADAGASLKDARNEARAENDNKLAILDKQFADLKPKLVKKFSEAGSATILKDLAAKSAAVRQSIDWLATATADNLEPLKGTIAQRLTDYDKAIIEAKKVV